MYSEHVHGGLAWRCMCIGTARYCGLRMYASPTSLCHMHVCDTVRIRASGGVIRDTHRTYPTPQDSEVYLNHAVGEGSL